MLFPVILPSPFFHGHRSVATAKSIVAEEFGKLGKFEARGVEEKPKIIRYAVPKDKLFDLVQRYRNMRRQHIGSLITEAEDLIRSSEKVELEHTRSFSDEFAYFWPQILEDQIITRINGAAVRLYLWLLVKQEEAARRNQWGLELTDTIVAEELGISIRTAGTYREELQKLGLLVIRGGLWMARYRSNFQLQPR
jgi:CRP-like cAMP-binding protein